MNIASNCLTDYSDPLPQTALLTLRFGNV